jgi:hypothetical protein
MPINVATMCVWTLTKCLNNFTGNLSALVCIFLSSNSFGSGICDHPNNDMIILIDYFVSVSTSMFLIFQFNFKSSRWKRRTFLFFLPISNCERLLLTMFIYLWWIYFDVLREKRKNKKHHWHTPTAFSRMIQVSEFSLFSLPTSSFLLLI